MAERNGGSSLSTRARLLDAGAEVFAESGYQQAKIRQICARAGTNIALVNYHFGDKMGLYREVLQQSLRAGHADAIRSALNRSGTPEDMLRAIVRTRMHGMCSGEPADRQFRIILHELAHPTPALAGVIDEILRPLYNRLLELIGGMAGLSPKDEKTRLCAHSVMGQILIYGLGGPVLRRLWPELKMQPEQAVRIADHIADFTLAYLREVRAARKEPRQELPKSRNRRIRK